MKWFKEHKKVATIGLAGIFLLVLILIGCGVAFSDSGNGSDQKEQEASVTDEKKDTVTEEKSSDTEVKKEDAAKEEVSEQKKETKEEAKKEEKTEKKDDTKKTSTASAKATTKKDEAKTSSNKSSSNSSTKKTETKSNGSSSSSSSQSKPQHTHTWVAQTKSVYHEATGHYENKWVEDSAAWDEDQYTEKVVCGCGATFDSVEGTYGWEQHSIDGCNYGYSVLPVKTGTIHHEATGHNEQTWVQDSAAWTETVTTGYKCSGCGATK
jgi:site-specific DNA-cytosine methylase